MNVVIVNDYGFVNGGASSVAIASAVGLAEQGFLVTFFCGAGPVDPLLEAAGVVVSNLGTVPYPQGGSVVRGLWDSKAKAGLEDVLVKLPASETVVHIHSHRDALSNSVLTPAIKAKIPLIYTCHEYGLACPYAGFYDHPRNAICHRRALSFDCLTTHCNRKGYDKKLWTYARGAIQNGLVGLPKRLTSVVFVSDFSRKILEPYVGENVAKHTVRNPVRVQQGQKRKLQPESPFVFVGLLTSGKDPLIAARAAALAGVPIKFVGDGELREEVMLANPDAVVTGWLKSDEVVEELKNARAIVFPARWYETQGLVVQEAAALGVPAIVTRTSAASDSVDHQRTGLLIDSGSDSQLAEAMQLMSDDATACALGEAAFAKFWSDAPSIDRHVREIASIYEEALARA